MRWPFGKKRQLWKGFRALAVEKAIIDGPPLPPPGHEYCTSCGETIHGGDLYDIGVSYDIAVCERCLCVIAKQLAKPESRGDCDAHRREILAMLDGKVES